MTEREAEAVAISVRDERWLRDACAGSGSGLYDGTYYDDAPSRFSKLERRGLVEIYHPHNPAHKTRVRATKRGRAAIAALDAVREEK